MLTLIESGRQVAARTATQKAAVTQTAAPARTAEAVRPVATATVAPMRGGLKGLDPQLNRQIAGTQRALEFLDRAGSQLQDLKAGLTTQLVGQRGRPGNDTALEQQIRRFDELWRERSAATGGTLDGRLDFDATGQARQQFSVRGLRMASLRSGDQEILSFSLGSKAQRSATAVVIGSGLSDAAIAQRLDRALTPIGIRATRDAQGELSFSVPESAWPAVRDGLAIKGEGRRFPTGQFSLVRTSPEEPAIRPPDWSTEDAAAVRRTLQQVLNAHDQVRNARQAVDRALTAAGDRLQPPSAAGESAARWSAEFAQTFESTASRGDYQALSAMTPALLGISRDRVLALLGPASS